MGPKWDIDCIVLIIFLRALFNGVTRKFWAQADPFVLKAPGISSEGVCQRDQIAIRTCFTWDAAGARSSRGAGSPNRGLVSFSMPLRPYGMTCLPAFFEEAGRVHQRRQLCLSLTLVSVARPSLVALSFLERRHTADRRSEAFNRLLEDEISNAFW